MTTYEKLCAMLLDLDTTTMTTADVVAACKEVEPTVTRTEIAAALRDVAAAQLAEAEQLERYGRTRRAGIRGVIRGGRP